MDTGHRIAGIWVSDVTAGFASWLEEVSALWESRQRGEKVPLPRWLLLGLLFVAAVVTALCVGWEMATQAMARRSVHRQAVRATLRPAPRG
ncbi:MAG TPA: hypothetical protein VES01_07635 [Dermatophilaceae bacterium]|nr:hypothetical protein [Dermatophilaceae bacterium]